MPLLLLPLSILLLLLPKILSQADGWHLDTTYLLVNERLDPIVNPNGVSAHMHKVIGGSMFGANYNYDDYSRAKCSSLMIQADKSNYWMPSLYMRNPKDNLFYAVGAKSRFYYFNSISSPFEYVQPFPKGLRMLVGNPSNKSPVGFVTFICQRYRDALNSTSLDNFNFPSECPHGMKTETTFPNCWDGMNLYKEDGSHMAYGRGNIRDGPCPISHPVRVPSIMLEFTWFTSGAVPGVPLAGNMFWANGDSTGYGVHTDFVNGWDVDILGAALNSTDCNRNGRGALPMATCPILAAHMDDAAARNCVPERGYLNESSNANFANVATANLPGCNPVWSNGSKPDECPWYDRSLDNISGLTGTDGSLVAPASDQAPFVMPTSPGWQWVTCARYFQALTNTSSYMDPQLTRGSCQESCQRGGYRFAAVGSTGPGSWYCNCGMGLDLDAPRQPGMCTNPCPGNSTESCGGKYFIFDIFTAPPGTAAKDPRIAADGSTDLGCYASKSLSTGLIGAAKYTFNTAAMTNQMCKQGCSEMDHSWAMTYSQRYCFCGSDWTITPGNWAPSTQCTIVCAGNSSENCGDWYKGRVWNITGVSVPSPAAGRPAGYLGCYGDNGDRQLLTNSSTIDNGLTPSRCINNCAKMGYSFAGVKQFNQCYCGSTASLTNRQPATQCNLACRGNGSINCGSYYNMDIYSANATMTLGASTVTSNISSTGYAGRTSTRSSAVLTRGFN